MNKRLSSAVEAGTGVAVCGGSAWLRFYAKKKNPGVLKLVRTHSRVQSTISFGNRRSKRKISQSAETILAVAKESGVRKMIAIAYESFLLHANRETMIRAPPMATPSSPTQSAIFPDRQSTVGPPQLSARKCAYDARRFPAGLAGRAGLRIHLALRAAPNPYSTLHSHSRQA